MTISQKDLEELAKKSATPRKNLVKDVLFCPECILSLIFIGWGATILILIFQGVEWQDYLAGSDLMASISFIGIVAMIIGIIIYSQIFREYLDYKRKKD